MKDAIFLGTSKSDLLAFPDDARREAGFQLFLVQSGLDPSNWKPISTIGAGVRELRISVRGAFRVIYLATRPEGIYVLHCFQKDTQKTSLRDIELARARFKEIGG